MDRQTIDWYDKNAEGVARRYESVPGGISDFFRFVFAPGDSVLQIGSGSGRDAARLLDLGVHVHAVEPSAGLRPGLECVWSGRKLVGDFDVDHAIPFALWQDSSLWNLLPAAKAVNNQKRERLPSREIVRRRSERIVENWRSLAREFPSRFLNAAAALSGGAVAVRNKEGERRSGEVTGDAAEEAIELVPRWEKPLLSSFVEAIENTAAMRGAARWEP